MAQNEQTLIDRICSGDHSAFQELVERHKKKVYFLAYDVVGDHHDAEDISQEVFIKVFRSLKTFRRDAKMSSWLYQITVNTSIDHLRRKSSKPFKSMDDLDKTNFQEKRAGNKNTAINPEQSAEAVIMQNRVSQALQKVSPKERSVFVMRHYNELKTSEIAEILNVSQGTVKALLFRAIRKLRKELSFYLGNPGLEATYE
ncbi:MAG: RNA polymerase sigma factor [Candidatus Aminicenantes bacterium]|nr:RNA polymerase sigma factor [Candidatus Aminicenantes bacterium]